MKSCVIGAPRSRTTALFEKIRMSYPWEYAFNEYYLRKFNTVTENQNKFEILTNKLFSYNSFLIKIISNHLTLFNENNLLDKLNLEKYDSITLIERPDFFNQCCSLQIGFDTNVWHQDTNHFVYKSIKKHKFFLEDKSITKQILGVDKYIEIKQHLISKNILFRIYDYENFDDVKLKISDPKLNYSEMIINYDQHNLLTELFHKHFNYDTCKRDTKNFFAEYDKIKQNFIKN